VKIKGKNMLLPRGSWFLLASFALLLVLVPVMVHVHLLPAAQPHAALRADGGLQGQIVGAAVAAPRTYYSPHTRNLLATMIRGFDGASGGGSGAFMFNMTPVLVVRPEGGLSNRMRALASARAFARLTGRRLVAVWLKDVHCRAAYHDLFLPDPGLHVVNEPIENAIEAAAADAAAEAAAAAATAGAGAGSDARPSKQMDGRSGGGDSGSAPGAWYVRDLLAEAVAGGQHLHDASLPPLDPPPGASIYVRSNLPLPETRSCLQRERGHQSNTQSNGKAARRYS